MHTRHPVTPMGSGAPGSHTHAGTPQSSGEEETGSQEGPMVCCAQCGALPRAVGPPSSQGRAHWPYRAGRWGVSWRPEQGPQCHWTSLRQDRVQGSGSRILRATENTSSHFWVAPGYLKRAHQTHCRLDWHMYVPTPSRQQGRRQLRAPASTLGRSAWWLTS